MSMSATDGVTLIRRALLACEVPMILGIVDQLNLSSSSRVDIVIVAPLKALRKARIVSGFASSAPAPAIRFLADVVSNDALEAIVAILGEHAGEPTFEQLSAAVDALGSQGVDPGTTATMLAVAAASEVPAADHCRRLLMDDDRFDLPALDDVAPNPLVRMKVIDPQVKEQRQRRREQQRLGRQRQASRPAGRPAPSRAPSVRPAATNVDRPVRSPAPPSRRRVILTPVEAAEFDPDHALAGFVVEVEVPFDAPAFDPLEGSSKDRPVVVIAASDDALLVRPVYSKPASGRVLLAGWNRLGLDHPSYVDVTRVRVAGARASRRFARLSDEEWNAIF